MKLASGDKAPDFNIHSDSNDIINLTYFKGKNVILYFYPKDDTPGCTLESCGFRDCYADILKHNAEVVGVSTDNVSSHQRFKAKYDLPFMLLSDNEAAMCEAYGVMGERRLYGKTYHGIIRSTFLIDDQGIIQKIWRDVNVGGHIAEVMTSLQSISDLVV